MFAANAFALLGLRQLFFLLDGLLDRLVHLAYGLAVILGFIGAKLVVHALHTNELPFVNGGEHVTGSFPEVPTWLSLAVILSPPWLVTTVDQPGLATRNRSRQRVTGVGPGSVAVVGGRSRAAASSITGPFWARRTCASLWVTGPGLKHLWL